MPINKNALIRYQVLDRCFRNTGRKYYVEDLIEEINKVLQDIDPSKSVSKRQVLDDINFMESSEGFSADIERIQDGRKKFYRYSNPEFSINNIPIKQEEIEKIKAAIDVLARFEGMPQFDWVYEVVPLLQHKFGGLQSNGNPVVSFDFNHDLKGLEHFGVLFNAIINQQVLRIGYKRYFADAPKYFHFHPYHLKEYNNRWFVLGFNQEEDNPYWNLALDRIISIEATSLKYIQSETDWEEFFYDVVGVTRYADAEPVEIKLLFSKTRAPYVITKPLHPSQKHRFVGDKLEVRIRVIPNKELFALLLNFCPDIEVLEPEDVRAQFQNTLKESLKFNEDRY